MTSNLAFCFIQSTHFWMKIIRVLRKNDKKYMAIYKELLLLKKPIVLQLDQPERVVSEHEFV